MFENNTLENELVVVETKGEEPVEQKVFDAEVEAPPQEEAKGGVVLALPEVVTSGDEYPRAPANIFRSPNDEAFVQLTQVFKRQIRDYRFFLKFQKYVPVTHFYERPERSPHTYEKKYWNLTLFSRFCCALRQKAKHLITAPFSSSGDYAMFEREILYSPQKCPVYVDRSRAIMESNLKRFKRVLHITHRDFYSSEGLMGHISEDESSIKLGRFVRVEKPSTPSEEPKEQPVALIPDEAIPQTELENNSPLE